MNECVCSPYFASSSYREAFAHVVAVFLW